MRSKRVCGLILAAVMLFSSVPVAVHAEESPVEGYITVMAEGSSENYVCLKSNDTLFLSAEDLAAISGYELSIGDHIAFSKAGGMDSVTAVDIQNDGTVSAMGKSYRLTILNYQDKVYLPIANILYLLHAQWSMEDGKLVVQPLPKTIIDFLGENNDKMWENKINQTDLLINGESKLLNTLRSALAAVFNDFDPMMFILWWPGEGLVPALNDEFEEALLQIAVDDMDFLDTYGQQEISEMLQGSGFSQVKTAWGNIQSMLNLPDNLNLKDAVNKISEAADTNKSIKFNAYADISAISLDQLEEWSNKMQPVTDALTLLDYAIQVSEVATRSTEWGQDFLDQISVLTEFDDTGYNKMISDRVQLVANNLIKEYQEPIKSAVLEANEQAIALLLSEIWDVAPFGKFFALFNTGLAIAKTDEDIKTSIDAADLSYMVDCLVKTEHIAMTEMNRSYMDLIESRQAGRFTEDDLFRLRNCVMLSLRANMRNTAFLYYLNEQLTDDPIWESSVQARSLRQQIINDCAMVCQLMETESYDRLLLLESDFENMYSDEYGEVRTEITADIFTEGKITSQSTSNISGNSIGNINNGGLVAQSGDWIYYADINDGFHLYKMRLDGTGKCLLNSCSTSYINAVGDWLYYIESGANADFTLYKMRTDGSEKHQLSDMLVVYLYVTGDWIYYINGDWEIYKMRTDGSERYQLLKNDKKVYLSNLCVINDWIFFNSDDGLFKVRADGSDLIRLSDSNLTICDYEENWIYTRFTMGTDKDYRIQRIGMDGSGLTAVIEDEARSLNVSDGWIYYVDINGQLYKVRTDGSQRTKICDDDEIDGVHVLGDWIYYAVYPYEIGVSWQLYRIRTDGTERQKISQ